MNKNVYIILLGIMISGMITVDCNAKVSLPKKVRSWLHKSRLEKITQEEFPTASISSLSLNNCNGSVSITTGPKNFLVMRTIRRAKKEDILNNIEVIVDTSTNDHLAITTKNRNKNKNKKNIGFVEYELIVPASLDIALTITGIGNVSIKDVHGRIDVVANDTITITNTKKSVWAQTLKKGSINCINAWGPVEARSQRGNIIGENIAHSFDAQSVTGKVNVACKRVPSTSSINLKTGSGNIMLALPADTNAEICGHTTHGTFMSEHDITLKSYTTKLNKSAWNKFTKAVDGTLGTGEATIALHSTKGNVKIVETKTT